jgi:hypothetical protein
MAAMAYHAYYFGGDTIRKNLCYNLVLDFESWCNKRGVDYRINTATVKTEFLHDYCVQRGTDANCLTGSDGLGNINTYRKNVQSVLDHIADYQGYTDVSRLLLAACCSPLAARRLLLAARCSPLAACCSPLAACPLADTFFVNIFFRRFLPQPASPPSTA